MEGRKRRSTSVPSLHAAVALSQALGRASVHQIAPEDGSPHWPRASHLLRERNHVTAALQAGRRRLLRSGLGYSEDMAAATFMAAVQKADLPTVDALFSSGFGAYREPATGDTPLTMIAGVHALRALKYLLAHEHVDPSVPAAGGVTPLALAAAAADPRAVALLLMHAGVERAREMVNARDAFGTTPLIASAMCRDSDARQASANPSTQVAQLLLEAGADPWAEDDEGVSTMALAIASHNNNLVTTLLRRDPRLAEQEVWGIPVSRLAPDAVTGGSWARRGAILSLVWLCRQGRMASEPLSALCELAPLAYDLAACSEGVLRRVVAFL